MSSGEWQPVEGPVGHLTLRMSVECDHCNGDVPLNGPTERAACDKCMKDTPLTQVPVELELAAEGMQRFGSSYKSQIHSGPEPQCASCDAKIPIDAYLSHVGATTTIPCPRCNAACPTYPAPAWLKAKLPAALQIFGGDAKTVNDQPGIALELPTAKPEPVIMACPKCGGSLDINAECERTTPCSFCKSSIFLPDGLWKRLHPVRTMVCWTITFSGELVSTETLAKRAKTEAESQERQQRRDREYAEAEALEEKETKSRVGALLVGALLFFVVFGVFLWTMNLSPFDGDLEERDDVRGL